MMGDCACGTPQRADYYVEAVVTRADTGETESVDDYACEGHVAERLSGLFDPAEWLVLEVTVKRLHVS